jgi:hypothetical protein
VTIRSALARAILATVAWLATAAVVAAATPVPSAAAGGDPRSAGQGPGLVGDPVFALLGVLAIGLGALVLTLAYLRLTAPRRG